MPGENISSDQLAVYRSTTGNSNFENQKIVKIC